MSKKKGPTARAIEAEGRRMETADLSEHGKMIAWVVANQVVLANAIDRLGQATYGYVAWDKENFRE